MNATEQIAMLRRACEMVMDWYGAKLFAGEFHDKWNPPNMPGAAYADATYETAMAATATPPDDKILTATEIAHGRMLPDATVRHFHRAMTEAELSAVTTDVARLTKERDDALAKLAAKEKELADIYAAKTEPEFRADGNRIQQRRLTWVHYAAIAPQGDEDEAIAQRIADALNAGGKP